MKTLLDPACYERLLTRVRGLRPETPARWGRMTAHQMLAHLCDSMRQTLGDTQVAPHSSVLRWPLVRHVVMYWLPWPKGRIRGPSELFLTPPTTWNADLASLETLLSRFVSETPEDDWPEHPFFGPMTHQSWGRFSHRHFDHHLRQFGA